MLSAISFGQNDLKQKEISSLKEGDVKLSISLKQKIIKIGESIELEALIQNNFSREITTLPFYIDDMLGFFVIEIRNSQGKILQREDITNAPRGGSRTALNMIPDEKFETILQLTKSYNLPVGKYTITASFTALYPEKRERILIKSNSVTLTVVE